MPSDPSSENSFKVIKSFYDIESKLPNYKVDSIVVKTEANFNLQIVCLKVEKFPDVILTLKIPLVFTPPLSAIILFTGFQTGGEAVNLVGVPEHSIYVGFQYPWPIGGKENSIVWDWHRMEVIPVLMAVGMSWLHEQTFINPDKINVVNVSFGTLFYPLAQRILNDVNIYPKTIVFGYGGAEISEVIGNELKAKVNPFELELAKVLIRTQTWFIEPKYHLPHLRGPFLIVNGESDTVFPEASKELLINKLPDPKKIVTLPGAHIQPDKELMIKDFLNEVEKFFIENQAL